MTGVNLTHMHRVKVNCFLLYVFSRTSRKVTEKLLELYIFVSMKQNHFRTFDRYVFRDVFWTFLKRFQDLFWTFLKRFQDVFWTFLKRYSLDAFHERF